MVTNASMRTAVACFYNEQEGAPFLNSLLPYRNDDEGAPSEIQDG